MVFDSWKKKQPFNYELRVHKIKNVKIIIILKKKRKKKSKNNYNTERYNLRARILRYCTDDLSVRKTIILNTRRHNILRSFQHLSLSTVRKKNGRRYMYYTTRILLILLYSLCGL